VVESRWDISWHHAALQIPSIWSQGITGSGISVALLDTGVAWAIGLERPDFEYLDARGNALQPSDPNGHGTCCASVIANYQGGLLGVAPYAKVVSLQVLETGDSVGDIESALDFILKRRPDIDVVSCSFVMSRATDAVLTSVRELANSGRVVVAAAGDSNQYSNPFPEQTPNALTVAAVDSENRPIDGARLGPWIDCAAPGDRIPVALPGSGNSGIFGQSSAAAAVVSGVAALVLSALSDRDRRRQFAVGFEGLVKSSAAALPDDDPQAVGRGLIDPNALLAAAKAFT
jgi:subtilisin family serine protease